MRLFRNANIEKEFTAGLLSYQVQTLDGFTTRIHLRVDQDESGVVWVNANESFYLNASASLFTWCVLKKKSDEAVRKVFKKRFGEKAEQAFKDYQDFAPSIQGLMDGTLNACDLCQSGVDQITPFSKKPSAPYRVDLALTYGCNNQCAHCYNEKTRSAKSLNLDQWKRVLDKLAAIGIPHVVFTGGEPTTLAFLPDLVEYAETLGLVTGLNTNGRLLTSALLSRLAAGTLDHIQITLESAEEATHDAMVGQAGAWKETVQGIRSAVDSGIFTMTNTTLLRSNASVEKIQALLNFLKELGIQTVGLNALIYSGSGREAGSGLDEAELPSLLAAAREAAEANGQRILWYTPTQYCRFDPQQNHLGTKSCTAASYSMCVEPDGTVLPCQSWYQGVGNILNDSWDKIWNAPLCQEIRARKMIPQGCRSCDLLEICGGGCPLALDFKKEIHPQNFIPDCF